MKYTLTLIALAVLSLNTAAIQAQQIVPDQRPAAGEDHSLEYGTAYGSRPQPRDIIHQKAQARSHQRMARMAAMRWYGMSNERPTASPTPFTSLYSPTWQMPGGRPYAWYHGGWASSSVVLVR